MAALLYTFLKMRDQRRSVTEGKIDGKRHPDRALFCGVKRQGILYLRPCIDANTSTHMLFCNKSVRGSIAAQCARENRSKALKKIVDETANTVLTIVLGNRYSPCVALHCPARGHMWLGSDIGREENDGECNLTNKLFEQGAASPSVDMESILHEFFNRRTSQATDEALFSWTSAGEVDKTCSERRMRAETASRLASPRLASPRRGWKIDRG
ncbi:hypothetical protein PHSY_001224 [Pseudozyma hubeiensis SY62]|uniref:Uncharacterized protein n=1 Tax=Pseudozyma hubeiensis (strain SY62) TaxID=1305764 RepID=R9NY98_PSEHS|nr:hypothetical protein PHSY_001224 [Pseudozyma hubeiensis SY62]GAC93659.1 hypothetical protein PHSY_001224 [Pseudozyma hubeiensis SY62]